MAGIAGCVADTRPLPVAGRLPLSPGDQFRREPVVPAPSDQHPDETAAPVPGDQHPGEPVVPVPGDQRPDETVASRAP
ncbi:hypothetical protein Shyhy02_32580 [Streptomyces hygroscopicus subsp. hygroscopicus]|nr:hypothetical protein Shyhy02_32580 [Streptomyces hygroscopicus subsp. hygroscopicus]